MPGAVPDKRIARMYPPSKQKLLLSASVDSASSHTAVIDTLGYDRVSVGIGFASVAQTTPEITIKLGEGDTTSSFTDITAAVAGGVGGFTKPVPPTNTSVDNTMQFDVDCRTRKRYLLLTVTPFTTKVVSSWVSYGRPEIGPLAATNEGLTARVGL